MEKRKLELEKENMDYQLLKKVKQSITTSLPTSRQMFKQIELIYNAIGKGVELLASLDIDESSKVKSIISSFFLKIPKHKETIESSHSIQNLKLSLNESEKKVYHIKKKNIPDEPMQIFVKTITDKIITLDVSTSNTIYQVKEKIYKRLIIPIEQQVLTYAGGVLPDHQTLYERNIKRESTIKVYLKLRGGMYHESSGMSGMDELFCQTYNGSNITKNVFNIDPLSIIDYANDKEKLKNQILDMAKQVAEFISTTFNSEINGRITEKNHVYSLKDLSMSYVVKFKKHYK